LFVDFNAKVGREDIFTPAIGSESLCEIINDCGVRVINFAIPKNLLVESTTIQHSNVNELTLTSPDGKTQNQVDHFS
jgi:hypothetical protein